VLALLTWNKRDVSIDSLRAYVREARMLQRLGQLPFICVCDNGSTDGTAEALQAIDAEIDVPHRFILNPANMGSSIARNQILDQMREFDADYVLFIDGDIEVVPFSSFAMLRYMEKNGPRLGCIGADFREPAQTLFREKASTSLVHIDGRSVVTASIVCPTQYGMFRRSVFEDGVRFEETGPFTGAGWGFEDNDLAFQMLAKRYLIQGFLGMVYLHRAAGSSVKIMREKGIEADAIFEQRRQFIMDKWSDVPLINRGPLAILKKTEFLHQQREVVAV
jgi:glycosyltransferase involved in cell wall biosynthesis